MIKETGTGRYLSVASFRGLSTDIKPTNVDNGAEFLEIDTGDIYLFNEANHTWVKCAMYKPTDAQAEEYIGAWLDDHPEATTTVEDGAVTLAKLASDIHDDVADIPSIKQTLNKKASYYKTQSLERTGTSISVNSGDEFVVTTETSDVRLYGNNNLLRLKPLAETTAQGITYSCDGEYIYLNGTCSGWFSHDIEAEIPEALLSKTNYYKSIIVEGTVTESSTYPLLQYPTRYSGTTRITSKIGLSGNINANSSYVNGIKIQAESGNVFNNVKLGLYLGLVAPTESDYVAAVEDITDGENYSSKSGTLRALANGDITAIVTSDTNETVVYTDDLSDVDVVQISNQYESFSVDTHNGYITSDNAVVSTDGYHYTDYIDISAFDSLFVTGLARYEARLYAIVDSSYTLLAVADATQQVKRLEIKSSDIAESYPTAKYIRFCGEVLVVSSKYYFNIQRLKKYTISEAIEKIASFGNPLYGKKYFAGGDSFTEANNLGTDNYDHDYDSYKSYAYWIAKRNNMTYYNGGVSGSTMRVTNSSDPTATSPFALTRYQEVPEDADYITLAFGLNESASADDPAKLGTKDSTDITTMWGAYNTVFAYLIEHHPNAKIGVIIMDAWMTESYATALKEICTWWGIPWLDIKGDPKVPMLEGGRYGVSVNPDAVTMRNQAWYTDYAQGDSHPNLNGHIYRSTIIENFLRSL